MSQVSPLERLPSISDARRIAQAVAMLDAILSPDDWELRYLAYNAHWTVQHAMTSMRDGSGDEYFAVFGAQCSVRRVQSSRASRTIRPPLLEIRKSPSANCVNSFRSAFKLS